VQALLDAHSRKIPVGVLPPNARSNSAGIPPKKKKKKKRSSSSSF